MENIKFEFSTNRAAQPQRKQVIIGVVASGNLEALVERIDDKTRCIIDVETASHGFAPIWQAVMGDFVEQYAVGGLRISINDGGARPDTVSLRLAQAVRLMEEVE